MINIKKFIAFTVTFIANLTVLWLANHYMPQNYVLLSFMGSWWLALIASAFVWTIIVWFTQPVADLLKFKLKKGIGLVMAYLLANFVAIWGIARVGLGFGVKSSLWVLALAILANIVLFLIWKLLAKFKIAEM
ncbi:MAG: hypothetical protein NT162_04055 [Candidatus Woesebacteria bacterium]|nr:hypothetical protein [Candidatus Woesebacteria bacterium]